MLLMLASVLLVIVLLQGLAITFHLLSSGNATANIGGDVSLMLGGALVVSSATITLSIGLLKRREWGRVGVILLLLAGFISGLFNLWTFGTRLIQLLTVSNVGSARFENVTLIVAMIMTLSVCVVFGWLVVRLSSATIRREFSKS
jgi:hypothetical protein